MAQGEKGLSAEDLVAALKKMDGMMLAEAQWHKDAAAANRAGDTVDPDSSEAVAWCIHGVAWHVTGGFRPRQFPYRQICMALHAAMNRPMVTIQEHEAALTFAQVKAWLADAIEYAKSNDPWTPYLIQHPERLRVMVVGESAAI